MQTPEITTVAIEARVGLLHREMVKLAGLMVIVAAAFAGTAWVASLNRRMAVRDAAAWQQRGATQMASGDLDAAVASLRRATVKNPSERRYALELASALARRRQFDEARRALLLLREAAPEDREVNLQLARLAVDRQDVTEADRYFHNALYAPWPADQGDARRRVRLELVDVLLSHGQTRRAVSELLAISGDLAAASPAHVEVARRFGQAGDHRRALEQFQRALEAAPTDGAAQAGAGLEAFQLGQYSTALGYLRAAPAAAAGVGSTLQVVEFVVAGDSLARRIGPAERRRRLIAGFAYASDRYARCLGETEGAPGPTANALQDEALAFEQRLRPGQDRQEDTVEAGVILTGRLVDAASSRCPPANARDQALSIIARQGSAPE
ncbi:MAG: tetratricopeptide repeat protein [Acidobacteriota bacterium]